MAKKQEEGNKEQALSSLFDKIEKIYGKGSILKMDEQPEHVYDVISSGSFGLDLALGIGGYPRGRIVELYGAESSGKSSLTLHAIAEANKKGLRAAIIDSECAFDAGYAKALGVKMELLYLSQPTTAEEALEITNMLIDSGQFAIVVVDSVAAMVPKSELEGEMGDSKMGIMARLMSQAMRKIVGTVSKSNTLVMFINQTRLKIGIMFGNPVTTTGGEALKFYSSIRLEVSRGQQVKDGDEAVGNKTKVKVVKNKTAPPFRVAEFEIEFGKGINRMKEILDIAVENDIIKKSGSWFSYVREGEEPIKLGQGIDNLVGILNDNPEFFEEVTEKVKELYA